MPLWKTLHRDLILAGLIPFLVFTKTSLGEPKIGVQTRYYPVHGTQLQELYDSMQRNGPGGRFLAQTEWNIMWNYRWLESAGQCRLNGTSVEVEISMLMPQAQQARQFTPELKQSWDRFYDALLRHEHHHRDYGIMAARELEQSLSRQPARPCSGFDNDLSRLARDIIERYERLEKAYDRLTDHGINEGVVLQ